jgi:hypothetical protein
MTAHCDRNHVCARGDSLCSAFEGVNGLCIRCACVFCSDECKFRDYLGGSKEHPHNLICKCPERKRIIRQVAEYTVGKK